MKFITTFTFRPDPEARAEGIARFQKTGGLPPEGVKLLSCWRPTIPRSLLRSPLAGAT